MPPVSDWLRVGVIDLSIAIEVLIIMVIALIASWVLDSFIHRLVRGTLRINEQSPRSSVVKADTLSSVVHNVSRILVFGTAIVMSLDQIGFDVATLLTSAGIVGVAIGFGAQSIVRDLVSGFLIVIEDQFAVGDIIQVGENWGWVERLDLRRTVIRNMQGAHITIPNGEIRVVHNLTKDWSRVVFDVEVAYEQDIEKARGVLSQVAAELQKDDDLGQLIIESPAAPWVDSFDGTKLKLRMLIKTQPTKHIQVGRELRARVKTAFEREGISMPVQQQIIVLRDEREHRGKPN
jgi:moderate conductance mechanosensitive channel